VIFWSKPTPAAETEDMIAIAASALGVMRFILFPNDVDSR